MVLLLVVGVAATVVSGDLILSVEKRLKVFLVEVSVQLVV